MAQTTRIGPALAALALALVACGDDGSANDPAPTSSGTEDSGSEAPAVMLTDTSDFRYSNYHCSSGEDAVELLDHDFATQIVASTVGATAESLGLTP